MQSLEPPRARGWLLLLAFLLTVWEPLGFALQASSALSRLIHSGVPGLLLLLFRTFVTGLGIAAGIALWTLKPHAFTLAKVWAVCAAVGTVLTLATPYFPSNRLPGTTRLVLVALLAYYGLWLLYLFRSRRVRGAVQS
jgi:hypothetical protein